MRLGLDKVFEILAKALPTAPYSRISEAAQNLNVDDSMSGILDKIQRALYTKCSADRSSCYPWIRDIFGDGTSGTIVYCDDAKLYSATYSIAGDTVTLGTPSRVVMAYVPAPSSVQEALVLSIPENEILDQVSECDLSTELVPIREAALTSDGKGLLKLIAAGQGASRFYPKATLQKASDNKVFPKGMQMFMDHQTDGEESSRPEGSLANMMGVLEADATYQENGPQGAGIYAPVRVYSDYVGFVNERAPDMGNSIRAVGRSRKGQVAGKSTEIVEELVAAKSVDFVTRAGAGGKLVPLFESYRLKVSTPGSPRVPVPVAAPSRNLNEEHEGMTVEEKAQFDALQESVRKLTESQTATVAENATLRESAVRSKAQVAVANKLAACKAFPEKAKQRIGKFFESSVLPMKADNTLDTTVLESQIDVQIAEETAYIKECSPTSGVTGLGEAPAAIIPNAEAIAKGFNESIAFLAGVPAKKENK